MNLAKVKYNISALNDTALCSGEKDNYICSLGWEKFRVERWENAGRLELAHMQMCGVLKHQFEGSGAWTTVSHHTVPHVGKTGLIQTMTDTN